MVPLLMVYPGAAAVPVPLCTMFSVKVLPAGPLARMVPWFTNSPTIFITVVPAAVWPGVRLAIKLVASTLGLAKVIAASPIKPTVAAEPIPDISIVLALSVASSAVTVVPELMTRLPAGKMILDMWQPLF